jgi:hypothetical protein
LVFDTCIERIFSEKKGKSMRKMVSSTFFLERKITEEELAGLKDCLVVVPPLSLSMTGE